MQNVTQLRDELIKTFQGIQNGTVPLDKAKELSNCAGKIIDSAKVELVYCKLRRQVPDIPFLAMPKLIEAEEPAK